MRDPVWLRAVAVSTLAGSALCVLAYKCYQNSRQDLEKRAKPNSKQDFEKRAKPADGILGVTPSAPPPFVFTVLWDFENVNVPSNTCGTLFVRRITFLLQLLVPGCTVRIIAVGNIALLGGEDSKPRELFVNQMMVNGVTMHHVPSRKPESADKAILVDFALVLRQKPGTSGVAFCSGDSDFSLALCAARSLGFRTVLFHPHPRSTSLALINAVDDTFCWKKDVLDYCKQVPRARASQKAKARAKWKETTETSVCESQLEVDAAFGAKASVAKRVGEAEMSGAASELDVAAKSKSNSAMVLSVSAKSSAARELDVAAKYSSAKQLDMAAKSGVLVESDVSTIADVRRKVDFASKSSSARVLDVATNSTVFRELSYAIEPSLVSEAAVSNLSRAAPEVGTVFESSTVNSKNKSEPRSSTVNSLSPKKKTNFSQTFVAEPESGDRAGLSTKMSESVEPSASVRDGTLEKCCTFSCCICRPIPVAAQNGPVQARVLDGTCTLCPRVEAEKAGFLSGGAVHKLGPFYLTDMTSSCVVSNPTTNDGGLVAVSGALGSLEAGDKQTTFTLGCQLEQGAFEARAVSNVLPSQSSHLADPTAVTGPNTSIQDSVLDGEESDIMPSTPGKQDNEAKLNPRIGQKSHSKQKSASKRRAAKKLAMEKDRMLDIDQNKKSFFDKDKETSPKIVSSAAKSSPSTNSTKRGDLANGSTSRLQCDVVNQTVSTKQGVVVKQGVTRLSGDTTNRDGDTGQSDIRVVNEGCFRTLAHLLSFVTTTTSFSSEKSISNLSRVSPFTFLMFSMRPITTPRPLPFKKNSNVLAIRSVRLAWCCGFLLAIVLLVPFSNLPPQKLLSDFPRLFGFYLVAGATVMLSIWYIGKDPVSSAVETVMSQFLRGRVIKRECEQ